jgi:uncharacterized protein YbdZ (MbtH family)
MFLAPPRTRHCDFSTRRMGNSMHHNPFDDDTSAFFVLVNDEERHSLWRAFADIRASWRVVYGGADRATCLDYLKQT